MVFAKSVDKDLIRYTDAVRTDGTVCEAFRKLTEKLRSVGEVRLHLNVVSFFVREFTRTAAAWRGVTNQNSIRADLRRLADRFCAALDDHV